MIDPEAKPQQQQAIVRMTAQECIRELCEAPNIDQLRALVKVRRYLP